MSGTREAAGPIRLYLTGGWFDSPNVEDNAVLLGIVESITQAVPAAFVQDQATRLTSIGREGARALLAEQGVGPAQKSIAICLRDFRAKRQCGIHHYDRQFAPWEVENYLKAMVQLVTTLLEQTAYTCCFFPCIPCSRATIAFRRKW